MGDRELLVVSGKVPQRRGLSVQLAQALYGDGSSDAQLAHAVQFYDQLLAPLRELRDTWSAHASVQAAKRAQGAKPSASAAEEDGAEAPAAAGRGRVATAAGAAVASWSVVGSGR